MRDVEQYITCYENCDLRYVEALAMIGLVTSAAIENCEERRFQRIVVALVTGRAVKSKCYFEEEVKQSLKIITVYTNFARKYAKEGVVITRMLEEKD